MTSRTGIAPILASRTAAAAPELVERLPDGRLRCYACGHRCPIPEGREGVCRVRYNEGGVLRVPWGYVGALQCDPIEKKPFFHALPGSDAFSFGMLGCDLHCGYCQNWFTSQSIRDPKAVARPRDVSPEDLVALALESGAPTVVSTYNEPLITSEWAVAVFKEARRRGLYTGYVSNGNGTAQVLDFTGGRGVDIDALEVVPGKKTFPDLAVEHDRACASRARRRLNPSTSRIAMAPITAKNRYFGIQSHHQW